MPPNNIKRKGNIYYQMDLVKKHPFPDGSLEFAFAEDFIEHLSQVDAVIFLTEIFRTLQKNGVLRLSFPGFFNVLAQHFSEISYDQAKRFKAEAYIKRSHKHFLFWRAQAALPTCRLQRRKIGWVWEIKLSRTLHSW